MSDSDQPSPPSEPVDFSDAAEFSRNLSQIFEIYGQIASQQLDKFAQNEGTPLGQPDPLNLMPTMSKFVGHFWDNPDETVALASKFWSDQMALWQQATARIVGAQEPAEATRLPDLGDGGRRFAHPQWHENALFDFVRRSYLLNAHWSQEMIEAARPQMGPRDQRKIEFLIRNLVDAHNPANFAALNPEVMEITRAENGANLVRGAQMMLEDIMRGQGDLVVRQTDMSAFEVGRDMAITPGKVIFENELFQLIQYAPTTKEVQAVPLLFIPPWINKYYVLDLNEKKSLMKWLVGQGHTVFMMSWVNPDQRHGSVTWDDYMLKGALEAIDVVLAETKAPATNIASYCIGGTLAGTLMAHLSRQGDTRVASATYFTAQIDFEDAGELQAFVDEQTLELVDAASQAGYLPAQSMALAFNTLRANDLLWSYIVANYLMGKEPFPFDLLYWNSDSTRMPGQAHRYYLEEFYIKNAFAKGEMTVAQEHIGPEQVRGPVYHLAAAEDHIAPAASVFRGAKLMHNADVTFVLSGSGHIAGVVNPVEPGKYQFWTNDNLDFEQVEAWKAGAQETKGSWWPHWESWLSAQSDKRVKARKPAQNHKAIEDAPGRYVKERFDLNAL